MRKLLAKIFSANNPLPILKLDSKFQKEVFLLAKGKRHVVDQSKLQDDHLAYLSGPSADQYRSTPEYKFLSETFNEVPDLTLKKIARQLVIEKNK